MEELKGQAMQQKDASVDYAMLESELLTSQKLHDAVRERLLETGIAAELRDSNVFLLHRAEPAPESMSNDISHAPAWRRRLTLRALPTVWNTLLSERLRTITRALGPSVMGLTRVRQAGTVDYSTR